MTVGSNADVFLCVEGDDSAELISLEAQGVRGDADYSQAALITFRDPDNIQLELFCPRR